MITVLQRRSFFKRCAQTIFEWSPSLGLLGFRFCSYANPTAVGYRGWVEWFGRCCAFVKLDGKMLWMRSLIR